MDLDWNVGFQVAKSYIYKLGVQTEDEMVGWHHQLEGCEFEQAPGVGDGQGGLACYSPWGRKELDMTEQLNWSNEFTAFSSSLKVFS